MQGGISALFDSRVAVKWELGREPVPVKVELNGLAAMLRALAENARDAMPSGGRFTVVLDTHSLTEAERRQLDIAASDRCATITVHDTGVGMSSRESQRAFEPYFSTRPDRPGLGLAMVYGLTRRFGGAVRIETTEGQGTELRIFLPLVPDSAPPTGAAAADGDRP
jgi:signal transduction histidine kinase